MEFNDIEKLLKHIFNKFSENPHCIFLWVIDKYLRQAEEMMEDRFCYKRHARIIWDKITGQATAFTVRFTHEYLLWYYTSPMLKVAKNIRGKYADVIREQVKRHSQKPEIAYKLLEDLYPNKNKLELFARPYLPLIPKRPNWDVWGNEVESDIEL